ncbi:MAG: hypothetical protein O3A25_13940 [Acidobacteria bacterium]|nr:hypothetical protein [Acidobacteriota bacterium]
MPTINRRITASIEGDFVVFMIGARFNRWWKLPKYVRRSRIDSAGNWYCDDDSGGNSNPQMDLATAGSGRYDIWVGSYSANETLTSVLRVSELR